MVGGKISCISSKQGINSSCSCSLHCEFHNQLASRQVRPPVLLGTAAIAGRDCVSDEHVAASMLSPLSSNLSHSSLKWIRIKGAVQKHPHLQLGWGEWSL